ncbi:type 1 glutamine amidotransferase domain-containing protein [Colwellia sp. Bg11-28]|uniref:type 1 glutamine amidotransferase domain-containing protein n=1 Tax=Colwellia sp. Bg11-28 TaxID=2058305 RepID=UPI000C327C2B|nr:type 1 glutamine amidotransferase domain-containing protein [Colwellia sp. Bg11-28]PKH86833.1 type 1 glutamine amidotransferase domain-containing protein [Colwellia sp. Bg11-28]
MKELKQYKLILKILLPLWLIFAFSTSSNAKEINDNEVKGKVLIIISSDQHGFWLPEVVEPYKLLEQAEFEIDIASPKGGKGTASGSTRLSGKDSNWFKQSSLPEKLEQSIELKQVISTQYRAIYFAGGAGPMFDLVENQEAQRVTREIYENGGIISADCHGPAALINVKLSDGSRLISGRKLTAKANIEEGRWAKNNYPFLLEDKIVSLGGIYTSAAKGKEHVIVDGRLITGQNPASAVPMTKALILHLTPKEKHPAYEIQNSLSKVTVI